MSDTLSQRELLIRLKTRIDIALVTNTPSSHQRVRALLAANPRGATATFVQYNLGKRRREYLRQQQAADPPASSLQPTRSHLVRAAVRRTLVEINDAYERLANHPKE